MNDFTLEKRLKDLCSKTKVDKLETFVLLSSVLFLILFKQHFQHAAATSSSGNYGKSCSYKVYTNKAVHVTELCT